MKCKTANLRISIKRCSCYLSIATLTWGAIKYWFQNHGSDRRCLSRNAQFIKFKQNWQSIDQQSNQFYIVSIEKLMRKAWTKIALKN